VRREEKKSERAKKGEERQNFVFSRKWGEKNLERETRIDMQFENFEKTGLFFSLSLSFSLSES
jgi:hypothetical protein